MKVDTDYERILYVNNQALLLHNREYRWLTAKNMIFKFPLSQGIVLHISWRVECFIPSSALHV